MSTIKQWIFEYPHFFLPVFMLLVLGTASVVERMTTTTCADWADGGMWKSYDGVEFDNRFERCLKERGLVETQGAEKDAASP